MTGIGTLPPVCVRQGPVTVFAGVLALGQRRESAQSSSLADLALAGGRALTLVRPASDRPAGVTAGVIDRAVPGTDPDAGTGVPGRDGTEQKMSSEWSGDRTTASGKLGAGHAATWRV